MFSKLADLSLRARLVVWSALATALVTFLAGLVVCVVAHVYLYGTAERTIRRLADDLATEYAQFGGNTGKFQECVDDDVDEHDSHLTHICLQTSSGRVLYSTTPLRKRHHERRQVRARLADGNEIAVTRDTEDIRRFLLFLVWMFVGLCLFLTLSAGTSAYVIGGRILSLNELLREKDVAYAELRSLTDDIAHDLRTPLTRLAMAAESAVVGGNLTRLPDRVSAETHAMLELINTMLDISQTNAKIDRSPREALDLTALLRQSADMFAPVAEDAGLVLMVDLPAEAIPFSGHKGKFQQLVANLLENALKFTRRGGRIDLRLKRAGEAILIEVADTGCGIAADDLPHVFSRFWRADSSRNLPGNGLGLALVQAIVTSYGGTIKCRSQLGKGTTFTVRLQDCRLPAP